VAQLKKQVLKRHKKVINYTIYMSSTFGCKRNLLKWQLESKKHSSSVPLVKAFLRICIVAQLNKSFKKTLKKDNY